MSVIAPGAFLDAAKQHYPELAANLSEGSDWMELIGATDDPNRNNSPYYGPATQFLVDCFFDIVAATPELTEEATTPLARVRTANFVIHNYIGNFAVGPHGLLPLAYDSHDIATTATHQWRSGHLMNDRDHVLLGASVPFDDVARVAGGAALMLESLNVGKSEIIDTITRSTKLHIIAGVHGDKTPEITEELGYNYLEPIHFLRNASGEVEFNQSALEFIKTLLSPHGCPTARLKDGSANLFTRYWAKITHYLLENVNYEHMHTELDAQRPKGAGNIVIMSASNSGDAAPIITRVPLRQIRPERPDRKPKRKR